MKLEGKTIAITGASAGIGEALAVELMAEGAKLVLLARRTDRLKSLAHTLDPDGTRIRYYACDVSKDGEIEAALARARPELGPLHGMIANAGFSVTGDFEKLTIDDYRRQMETNIYGVLRAAYASLPDLKTTSGSLVVVGSLNSYVSIPGVSPYAMSKYALRGFTEAIFHEFRPLGVAVTLICPGFVVSEIRHVDNQGVYLPQKKDIVPQFLQMPTRAAARTIIRAMYRRKREVVFPIHAKIIGFIYRHFPRTSHLIFRITGLHAR